jgi:hypothetical protein
LLGGQGNVQSLDVLLKLLDFPTADYGEHVGEFVQMIRDNNCKRSSSSAC